MTLRGVAGGFGVESSIGIPIVSRCSLCFIDINSPYSASSIARIEELVSVLFGVVPRFVSGKKIPVRARPATTRGSIAFWNRLEHRYLVS